MNEWSAEESLRCSCLPLRRKFTSLSLAARAPMSVEIVGEKFVENPAQQCDNVTDKTNGSKFVNG